MELPQYHLILDALNTKEEANHANVSQNQRLRKTSCAKFPTNIAVILGYGFRFVFIFYFNFA